MSVKLRPGETEITKTKEEYEAAGREFTEQLLAKHEGWTDEQFQNAYGHLWEGVKNQDTFLRLPIDEQSRLHQNQIIAYEEKQTSLAKIKAYAELDEVKQRFVNLLGDRDGKAYVESIVIAVANSDQLQECTPKSIMIAASRAASLKLSVDPILKQAHLVKFGKEATLIVDYHGLVQLSVNTNYYEDPPHVSEVYEGENVITDRLTGKVKVEGTAKNTKEIGWLAYFKAKNGTERFLYMTNEECDEWGKKYNPKAFSNPKTPWGTERPKMRRKTVLRRLVSLWGNFSPQVQNIIMRDDVIDADTIAFPSDEDIAIHEEPAPKKSNAQNMRELGFDNPDPVQEEHWNEWLALCEKADALKIEHPNPKRGDLTDDDLAMGFGELLGYVRAAKYQAMAGAEAQGGNNA